MSHDTETLQFKIGMLQTEGAVSLRDMILKTLGVGEFLRVAIAPVDSNETCPLSTPNKVVLEINEIRSKLRIQIDQAYFPGYVLNENGLLFWVSEYSTPPTKRNLNRIYRALLDSGFQEFDLAAAVQAEFQSGAL